MIIGMPSDAVSQPFSKSSALSSLKIQTMLAVESNYQEHIEAINLVRSSCSELIVTLQDLSLMHFLLLILFFGAVMESADSQHMAAELVGRLEKDRKRYDPWLLLQILQC